MKTLTPLLLGLTLLATSCGKEKVDQLSLLPPATQTGANTFGCLVNGAAFRAIVPRRLKCQYGYFGKYIFSLGAGVDLGDGSVDDVVIGTDSLKLNAGATLPLTNFFTAGQAGAGYNVDLSSYTTKGNATGQLTITRLDTVNLIVSGTFQFNAVNKNGDTVRITNGRFDLQYMP